MAEPGWALIVAGLGLAEMGALHCPTGCLAPNEVAPRMRLAAGPVVFGDEAVGIEWHLRRDASQRYGPFRLAYGLSATSRGALWAGAGLVHTLGPSAGGVYLETHVMPGLYRAGAGSDLGGPVNLRAGFELGWQTREGVRLALSLDHRSHGGLFGQNPGLETVQFGVSIPLHQGAR